MKGFRKNIMLLGLGISVAALAQEITMDELDMSNENIAISAEDMTEESSIDGLDISNENIAISATTEAQESPSEVARRYFREILQGDANQAVALTYFPPELSAEERAEIRECLLSIAGKRSGVRVEISEEIPVDDGEAMVIIHTHADGKVFENVVNVWRTDEGWKLEIAPDCL